MPDESPPSPDDGPFIHPDARVETGNVGALTRIWAFAHILPGACIGSDVNICDHVFIENDVQLGDRVTVKSGVQLWDGTKVEDDVFIGPNATFTNDRFPRSKRRPKAFPITRLCRGCSVGAGAVILPGITIGQSAMVGAGSVITRDVPPYAIVVGNPARITGYVGSHVMPRNDVTEPGSPSEGANVVDGVRVIELPRFRDMRGSLAVAEWQDTLPFEPRRIFVVYNVPSTSVRGEHAHRTCEQFLICVAGSCRIMVDDGKSRMEVDLVSLVRGLYIPPMIWASQYHYSSDAVLVVAASRKYDEEDYMRHYDDWYAEVQERRRDPGSESVERG
jgi:UDP-2-acetamido-3-amino-2,3-dideoxy-glucuronate N-acetyltransferase